MNKAKYHYREMAWLPKIEQKHIRITQTLMEVKQIKSRQNNKRDENCYRCCIFWPAFGCCIPQTLVEIVIFSIFCAKNLKKCKNLLQNQAIFFPLVSYLRLSQRMDETLVTRIIVDCRKASKKSTRHYSRDYLINWSIELPDPVVN